MSEYTIKNMLELEDATGGQVPGLQARFARAPIDAEHIGVTQMRYEPGVRTPTGHSHREQEEVCVVVWPS